MTAGQNKKPLAHDQGGFNPSVPERETTTQVGPLPTSDPRHERSETKSQIEQPKPKSSKRKPE
jgi:hypothetical protein